MTVGEKIKSIRKQNGISQQKLGSMLGVSQAMIAQYENGKRIPKIETLIKIAEALDCEVSNIMNYESITNEQEKEEKKFNEFPGNLNIDITKENYNKYTKYFNAAFSTIREIICNEINTKLFSVETGAELKKKDMEEIFDSLSIDEKLILFRYFAVDENFTINPIFDAININFRGVDSPTTEE